MYGYDDESYYEPSLVNEVLAEYQEKMKDVLLEKIKNEIVQIKEENTRLKEENNEYRKREKNIKNKEVGLEHKEKNLKREIEEEFYKSNIGDILKQYIEDSEIWFADVERYQNEKCNLCNEKRELVAEFPNGKVLKSPCVCAKILSKYIPALSEITLIKFYKRDSRYPSNRKFYLARTYKPIDNRDDDYEYQDFKICHIIHEFNEDVIELHRNKSYSERLGFESKEECQKYCDWLNEEKVVSSNAYEKI